MKYTVSALKYRPQKFSEVVGQEAVTRTLRNAIKTGKLAHAYLFAGPRGVGKTTCARIFAKTINCENPTPEGEACDKCTSCIAFNQGKSFNIHELDAASNNSVEDIRNLIEQVRIPPQIGKYSVYIIDEVHMLSQAAFNAFLKTLEEPPEHAIFIMATTEKHKILPTILSRCQVFDFHRIKVSDIVNHLKKIAQKENIEVEDDALSIIAAKADGALRDALSIFDQLVSFSQGKLTYQNVIKQLNVLDFEYYFKLTDFFLNENYQDTLLTYDSILEKGFDPQIFLNGLSEHFRNLLVAKDSKTLDLLDVGQNIKNKYKEQAKNTPLNFILRALEIINYFDINYKTAQNKRLHVELALIQLSQLKSKLQAKKSVSKNTTSDQAQKQSSPTKNQQSSQQKKTSEFNPQTPTISHIINGLNKSPNTATKQTPNQTQPTVPDKKPQTPTSDANQTPQQQTATQPTSQQPENLQIDPKQIKTLLSQFAQQYAQNNKRLNVILTQYPFSVKNNIIQFSLSNDLQVRELNNHSSKISQFLKQKLNISFKITSKVEKVKIQRKPITTREKYKFLLEKNPKLQDLKNRFDLDL